MKNESKKVVCKHCKNHNVETSVCSIKKIGTKTGKRRFCSDYVFGITTVVIRPEPASRYAPIWEVDGTERRKMMKTLIKARKEQAAAIANTAVPTKYLEEAVVAPDCLANIRSSAVEPDEIIS